MDCNRKSPSLPVEGDLFTWEKETKNQVKLGATVFCNQKLNDSLILHLILHS